MIKDIARDLKLSPAMIEALRTTGPDDIMAAGPSRAALMRRGLVLRRSGFGDRFGYLTERGREVSALIREEYSRDHS